MKLKPDVNSHSQNGDCHAGSNAYDIRLTYSIYRVVSVALFANHQLTFSFMLCSSIMRANDKYEDVTTIGKITDFDWSLFLQGNILANMMDEKVLEEHDGLTPMERLEYQARSGDPDAPHKKVPPIWVTDSMWKQCQHLDSSLPSFDGLCRSLITDHVHWELFKQMEDPFKGMQTSYKELTGNDPQHKYGTIFGWEKLSGFHRLILIKVLRPDALMTAIRQFVEEHLGHNFISTGSFDLKEIYDDSTAKTPLIFILSPGTDPLAQLVRFAEELRGSALHLDMISLGRDQGPKAEELISKAQILKGRWVFLQNCHLAASFMPRLQAIVEKLSHAGDDLDPQFRLWLSSKPDSSFPISILQTGMKMTVEPPQGLKANMLRSFGSGGTGTITEKKFEYKEAGPDWQKLLFGLCLFNSVIHERKKYGRLGWNVLYEFNDSDLSVSVRQLQNLLEEHDEIPWEALTFLTGEVIYGGRVTDEWDMRCLGALLKRFLCPEALNPDYSYSPDGLYRPIKTDIPFADVITYLESLPNYDSPELFGMTNNAEKACREMQAHELIDTIINVQPRLSLDILGTEKSNDDVVLEVANDILKLLPVSIEDYTDVRESHGGQIQNIPRPSLKDILFKEAPELKDKEKERIVQEAIDTVVGNSALMTVLRQEVDRFNHLLAIIHESLKALILAVKGEVIMSESLEEAYTALLSQKVPQNWKNASYESCKQLGSWTHDLMMRVEFFATWAGLICGNVEKLIKANLMTSKQQSNAPPPPPTDHEPEDLSKNQPRAFWLSGFFFPQGFLTGVQQNHARKLGISVDSLVFNFQVKTRPMDTEESLCDLKHKPHIKTTAFKGNHAPENGVLVFGLFLDGASWDPHHECLNDSRPGDRFSKLPEIHFEPVQIGTAGTPESSSSDVATGTTKTTSAETYKTYKCPLYRTSARAGTLSSTGHSTNFVTAVDLPSKHLSDFWVMRGIAMLCQLDD